MSNNGTATWGDWWAQLSELFNCFQGPVDPSKGYGSQSRTEEDGEEDQELLHSVVNVSMVDLEEHPDILSRSEHVYNNNSDDSVVLDTTWNAEWDDSVIVADALAVKSTTTTTTTTLTSGAAAAALLMASDDDDAKENDDDLFADMAPEYRAPARLVVHNDSEPAMLTPAYEAASVTLNFDASDSDAEHVNELGDSSDDDDDDDGGGKEYVADDEEEDDDERQTSSSSGWASEELDLDSPVAVKRPKERRRALNAVHVDFDDFE
jgi:hypothetical protein